MSVGVEVPAAAAVRTSGRAGPGGRRRGAAAGGGRRGEWRPAAELPVARVAVDVALAHLDRPFDYRVPAQLDEAAVPGVRLRVRFAGRLVDGFLLERVAESTHGGALAWVEKVVSAEPVLTGEVARLCRAVADRYAGVLADVLRLAVPPRHARVEAEPVPELPAGRPAGPPGAGRVGPVPARPDPAGHAGRRPRRARGVAGAARGVLDGAAGRGRGRDPGRRPRGPAGGARPARRRRPARRLRGPGRAGPGGRAHRGARPRGALPALARGAPRPGAGGGGHPVRGVRPGVASSGCSPSGTTATTCTPSRGPRTRTSVTCSRCGPTRPGPRCWSAGSAGPRRRSCWSSPAGPARCWPTGPPCARRCRG